MSGNIKLTPAEQVKETIAKIEEELKKPVKMHPGTKAGVR